MEDNKKQRIQLRLDKLSDKDILNKISKIKSNTHKPLATIVVAILRQSVPFIDEKGNMNTSINKQDASELNNSIEIENKDKDIKESNDRFTHNENINEMDLEKILNKANFKEE